MHSQARVATEPLLVRPRSHLVQRHHFLPQLVEVVGPPLQHLLTLLHVCRAVVGTTGRVPHRVPKLHFDPGHFVVEAFDQQRPRRCSEPVRSVLPLEAQREKRRVVRRRQLRQEKRRAIIFKE